jgi:hypothetical protein
MNAFKDGRSVSDGLLHENVKKHENVKHENRKVHENVKHENRKMHENAKHTAWRTISHAESVETP